MDNIMIQDKYSVFKVELKKESSSFKNIDEILSFLKNEIEKCESSSYIAIFNHFKHTKSLSNGEIADDILDAKNIVFCFGVKLPSPEMLALRPRSIGVGELKDSFVVSFMEAPMEFANSQMSKWVEKLKEA